MKATLESESTLKHFNQIISIYQPDGPFSADFEHNSYKIIRKRQHLGGGLYNPYYAIRCTRKSDGKVLYETVCHEIYFDDGTVSIYWWNAARKIFALDNVKLP